MIEIKNQQKFDPKPILKAVDERMKTRIKETPKGNLHDRYQEYRDGFIYVRATNPEGIL